MTTPDTPITTITTPNPLASVLADTIADLAAERALREAAEADRDIYRQLAQVALGHVHRLSHSVQGLTRALAAVRRDERRAA